MSGIVLALEGIRKEKQRGKAILIEVCFVDDRDDYELYKKIGYQKVAETIADGIIEMNDDWKKKVSGWEK